VQKYDPEALIFSEILSGYLQELKYLLRGKKPVVHISHDLTSAINILLKDIKRLLDDRVGIKYLSTIPENEVTSISEVIVTLSPYQALLQHYLNNK